MNSNKLLEVWKSFAKTQLDSTSLKKNSDQEGCAKFFNPVIAKISPSNMQSESSEIRNLKISPKFRNKLQLWSYVSQLT